MSKKAIFIFLVFISSFANAQLTNVTIDTSKYLIEIGTRTGGTTAYSWFTNYLDNYEKIHTLLIHVIDTAVNAPRYQYRYLKINERHDTIFNKKVAFQYPFEGMVELNNYFYLIHSFKSTMDDPSKVFLAKYDTNWQQIWIKDLNKDLSPDDNFLIVANDKNELLIFAQDYLVETNHIIVERRNENGDLIASNSFSPNQHLTKSFWTHHNLTKTSDNNYLVTTRLFADKNVETGLYLMKLNQHGDTIWTKFLGDIEPTQTLIRKNGDIVVLGKIYETINDKTKELLKVIATNKSGEILWTKVIAKTNHCEAGSVVETADNTLLFSGYIDPIGGWVDKIYLFELGNNGNVVYEKVLDAIPTCTDELFLPEHQKLVLCNSTYYPNWYEAHTCGLQFIRLIKNNKTPQ